MYQPTIITCTLIGTCPTMSNVTMTLSQNFKIYRKQINIKCSINFDVELEYLNFENISTTLFLLIYFQNSLQFIKSNN